MKATVSARDPADLVGRVVGKYEVVRELGAGGMGRVYECVHVGFGRRVALKFLDPACLTDDAVERFQREAQAAGSVESPHIVQVFDVGATDDGLPYLVMELLRGEDLGHRIRRLGRLEVEEMFDIGAQLLRGLARAHDAGIVHRDLKPENVFLEERDDHHSFVKILDFGVSKIRRRGPGGANTITREGVVLGTPVYMSPEQAQALPDVDARSDLWSFGAIVYECLSGRPPHSGATYEQVIVSICMKDADDVRLHNPGVPEPVAELLRRALARDRDARFESARELLEAWVEISGGVLPAATSSLPSLPPSHRTVITPPGSRAVGTLGAVSTVAARVPITAPGGTSRRSPWLVAGLLAAVGAVGAGLVVARSDEAAPKASQAAHALPPEASAPPAPGVPPEPPAPEAPPAGSQVTASQAGAPASAAPASAVPARAPASAAASAPPPRGTASAVALRRGPAPTAPVTPKAVAGDLQLKTE